MARTGTRRSITAGAIAVALLCLTPGPASARPDARATDGGPLAWRREVLSLMNDARANAHVPRLRVNVGLSRNAQAHTRKMIAERRVFRTANVGDLVEPYGATLWAEELARGRTLRANVRAWLHHADTRRHLLDPRLRSAAIGVAFANGRFWVTVYLHN